MEYVPKIGDFVWAKMKTYPPWPSRVIPPRTNDNKGKKGLQCVYFFGSWNYGWVEDCNITPYEEHKDANTKNPKYVKVKKFKDAVLELEECIKEKAKDDPKFEKTFEDDIRKKIESKIKKTPVKKTPVTKRKSTESRLTPVTTKKARTSNPPLNTSELSGGEMNASPLYESSTSVTENGSASYIEDLQELPPTFNSSESSTLNLEEVENNFKKNKEPIKASNLTFGFMGLGVMGSAIVKNLIISGHRVNLYNRTADKSEKLKMQAEDFGLSSLVRTYTTPTDIVENSDIIFSCVSDPSAAQRNVVGNCGVVYNMEKNSGLEGKGYVEMTSIDPTTSQNIAQIIKDHGGMYLEAQLQGSKQQAEEANLIVLTAGDKPLFEKCQSCFKSIGKTVFFLGNTGYATKMNLFINLATGISLAGLVESMVLAERSGLSIPNFLEIFEISQAASSYLSKKGKLIMEKRFRDVEQAIKYMQKDIKLCLDISDNLNQHLPVSASVNEVYKTARRFGYDDFDVCGIFMKMRH